MDYAGQDQFPGMLELPADNTQRDAASTNVPIEALADRTIWLKNQTAISQHAHSAVNLAVLATFSGTNYAQSNISRTVNNARAGEWLSIDLALNLQYLGNNGGWGSIRVAVIERWGTPSPATYATQGEIIIMGATGATTHAAGASLITMHPVQSDGNVRVVVEGRTEASANAALRIVGSYGLRVLKHRS